MPDVRISAALRRQVIERAERHCEYCSAPLDYSPDPFNVEHITPRSSGGPSTLDNLALACFGCNRRKFTNVGGLDEVSNQTVTLFHPRKDNWNDHFSWQEYEIVPVTATGRVTLKMLALNRVGLLNLRRLLTMAGLHPPID